MTSPFRLRSVAVSAYGPALLYGFSAGVIAPVIAISAIERGATVAVAGLVVSLMGIGALVSNIPSGVLTTRFGERRCMVAGAAINAGGIVLCLFNAGIALFAAGVLAMGIAGAVFQLTRQSYLTEIVPLDMRARACRSSSCRSPTARSHSAWSRWWSESATASARAS